MLTFFSQHPFDLLVAYWLFSAAASALPSPTDKDTKLYIWFHNFAQLLLANVKLLKFPNSMPIPKDMQ